MQTGWENRIDGVIEVAVLFQDKVNSCDNIHSTMVTEYYKLVEAKILAQTWAKLMKEGLIISK